ncbi:MAG: DNA-processing protein DprA [Aeromonas sp.]
MKPAPLSDWLTLAYVQGIGPVTAARLIAAAGGIHALLQADDSALATWGLTHAQRAQLRSPAAQVAQALAWAQSPGNYLLTPDHPAYPMPLRQIPGAPLLLYVRGELDSLSRPQLAMVGTRHPTYAGKDNANRLSSALAAAGLTITSGLALGIDGVCHQAALDAGGHSIAVLGSGLDALYPKRHQGLAKQLLASGGALVSEFLPTQGPLPEHFPRRNRIISGLSLGVVVIEATEKSGSLITARYALEQGREVFAVPGAPQNSQALGCNRLIQQGAKLVLAANDVFEELGLALNLAPTSAPTETRAEHYTPAQAALLGHLDETVTSVDTLCARCQQPAASVLGLLVELELAGAVCSVAGGYVKTRGPDHV